MSTNPRSRPIPRRPLPRRKGHRLRAVGEAAAEGGMLLGLLVFIVFCLAAAVMPFALMGAAIYWLVTH